MRARRRQRFIPTLSPFKDVEALIAVASDVKQGFGGRDCAIAKAEIESGLPVREIQRGEVDGGEEVRFEIGAAVGAKGLYKCGVGEANQAIRVVDCFDGESDAGESEEGNGSGVIAMDLIAGSRAAEGIGGGEGEGDGDVAAGGGAALLVVEGGALRRHGWSSEKKEKEEEMDVEIHDDEEEKEMLGRIWGLMV